MHLRKAKIKGRVYLSIVQSYRTPDGKTRSKTIETIGYADAFEGIYDDPIAHFEAEVERRNAEAKEASAPIIVKFSPAKKIDKRAEGRIELGAAVPSAYFHRDLGIWEFFEKRRTARKFAYDPCRILELLAWNRIADPGSKKAAFESRGRFPRKCDFSLDDVYRSLTYLNTHADALVKHMNERLESVRGPRDRTRLYYDVTNYYFEVENEDIDGLRKRGVSKEHRPSPIVQMGLFLDGDGLPFDYEIFAGNANDMTTMLPAKKKAGLRHADDSEADRIIVVADKGLNTSNNTKVRIDPIIVAPDGSLSGPGMACTTVAKQTYALPARPDLDGGAGVSSEPTAPTDVRPISNATLKPEDNVGAPVNSSGFLGAPTPLNSGVLESSEPAVQTATQSAPVTAPGSAQGSVTPAAPAAAATTAVAASSASASGDFVVQVGAVSDRARAQQYQQRLSQQFSVPGRVVQNGAVWRIQLGPFASKSQASTVQQRLQSEAQLQSFITHAN